MRGLKVAVLEKKREPGARVSTTGILVKEAAEEIDIPYWLTRRVPGVRLYAPNLRHVDLFSPGTAFLTTRTAELLRWLAREAVMAGAKLVCGARVEGAERQGGLIRIRPLGVSCRYLVGADGARSRIAAAFGLGRNRRFLTGIEAEFAPIADLDPRFLHCFIDSRLAPGYLGWLAAGPDVVQAGLAVRDGARPDLARFLAGVAPVADLRGRAVAERRSGLIPCGGPVEPFAAPGVLLIGDAAGWVSPLTGGGIRLAFHFGRRAAALVADHLLNAGPAPERALSRELPSFPLKRLARRFLDLAPPNALLDLALATPPVRALAERFYFHRRGGRGMDPAAYRRWLDGEVFAPPRRLGSRGPDDDGPRQG
jgi:flavin-dependent dehydrogenase